MSPQISCFSNSRGLLGKGSHAHNNTNVKYDSVWMGTPTRERVIVTSLSSPLSSSPLEEHLNNCDLF